MRRILAATLIAGLAACQQKPAELTDAQKTAIADSAKAVVQAGVSSINKLDLSGAFLAYSGDPDAKYVEAGVMSSLADMKKSMVDMSMNLESLDNVVDEWHTVVLGPDAVAITSPFHFTFKMKGKPAPFSAKGVWSGVVQRRAGKWMIVQSHESWVDADKVIAEMSPAPAKPAAKAPAKAPSKASTKSKTPAKSTTKKGG